MTCRTGAAGRQNHGGTGEIISPVSFLPFIAFSAFAGTAVERGCREGFGLW